MQSFADRQADEIAARLGSALKDTRTQRRMTQRDSAAFAGLSASTWSWLETAHDGRVTLATLNRAAHAVGSSLSAYLKEVSGAGQPRDAVHLGHQELVIKTSRPGSWRPLPEELIDRDARTSRAADVLLVRTEPSQPTCYALVEIWDWLADVGAAVRDWSRRLEAVERYAIGHMVGDEPLPRTAGVWVLRATHRNQQLVQQHRGFFKARFPGSGSAWLAALSDPTSPMPGEAALVWVSVKGDRLFAARFG